MLATVARKLRTFAELVRNGRGPELRQKVVENAKVLGARVTGVELDGCKFRNRHIPDAVMRSLISEQYEAAERSTIREHLDPTLPLVELGGGIGVIACIANQLLERPRTHVVVEANSEAVPIILANAKHNGCELSVVNFALAYGCSEVTFNVNRRRPYSSALVAIHRGTHQVTVPAITMARLFERFKIERCSLISDIEGAEYDMVANELPLLRRHVSVILMETHPKIIGQAKTDEMLEKLAGAGYHTLAIANDVHVLATEDGPRRKEPQLSRI